jgi:excisionase family DNA binding protein
MTVAEVAHYLRIHKGTVYRLVEKGKIPGFRVGSGWRFSRHEIERRLRERGS